MGEPKVAGRFGRDARSVTRHFRINLGSPGIDATCNVGDMLKATRFQKGCDLHAAPTVVAQASYWPIRVQLIEPWRDHAHGNSDQLESFGLDARCLKFMGLAHIQNDGLTMAANRFEPIFELQRADVFDHVQNLKLLGWGKFCKRGALSSHLSSEVKLVSLVRVTTVFPMNAKRSSDEHHAARIMRMPGSLHWKAEPYLVKILWMNAEAKHLTIEELVEGLGLEINAAASRTGVAPCGQPDEGTPNSDEIRDAIRTQNITVNTTQIDINELLRQLGKKYPIELNDL